MAKNLVKKISFNETDLYIDGMKLLSYCLPIVKNMEADKKIEFGHDFIITIRDFIEDVSLAYKSNDNARKVSLVENANKALKLIEIKCQTLFDIKYISFKQSGFIAQYLGNLNLQLNGWYKKLTAHRNADGTTGADE